MHQIGYARALRDRLFGDFFEKLIGKVATKRAVVTKE